MQPNALRKRIMEWAKEEERVGGILPHSTRVLAHILTHRELEAQGRVTEVVGFDDRKARRVNGMLHRVRDHRGEDPQGPFSNCIGASRCRGSEFQPGTLSKKRNTLIADQRQTLRPA